jgi:hypothetical protein
MRKLREALRQAERRSVCKALQHMRHTLHAVAAGLRRLEMADDEGLVRPVCSALREAVRPV